MRRSHPSAHPQRELHAAGAGTVVPGPEKWAAVVEWPRAGSAWVWSIQDSTSRFPNRLRTDMPSFYGHGLIARRRAVLPLGPGRTSPPWHSGALRRAMRGGWRRFLCALRPRASERGALQGKMHVLGGARICLRRLLLACIPGPRFEAGIVPENRANTDAMGVYPYRCGRELVPVSWLLEPGLCTTYTQGEIALEQQMINNVRKVTPPPANRARRQWQGVRIWISAMMFVMPYRPCVSPKHLEPLGSPRQRYSQDPCQCFQRSPSESVSL